MTNSKTLLSKLLGSPTKKAILAGLFSFLGLVDASYLAAKHYTGTIPPCAIVKGCEVVTTSQYAAVGRIFRHRIIGFNLVYLFAIIRDKSFVPLLSRFSVFFRRHFYNGVFSQKRLFCLLTLQDCVNVL